MLALGVITILTGLAAQAEAQPAAVVVDRAKLAKAAAELVGLPYDLGGRRQRLHSSKSASTRSAATSPITSRRGVDCQAVVFYALERASRCGWKSFSVMPAESIAREELGTAVKGAAPVSAADLDSKLLQAGDVVYLLGSAENASEESTAILDDTRQWTWHMGVYVGGGAFVHADFITGEVQRENLRAYLLRHHSMFSGVYMVRPDKVAPKRCRRHRRMPSPQ